MYETLLFSQSLKSFIIELLQKALWCTVLSVQFSEKRVFYTVYCHLKTENLDFAKVQL